MRQVATESDGGDVVRWYTRARKFPQLIGRTTDGARIPGGPYTITQVFGAGGVLLVGLNTMSLWARFGLFTNIVVLGTATFVTIWLLGRIPIGARNPLSVVSGVIRAVIAPGYGRMGGRTVRIQRPHRVRHRVLTPLLPAPTSIEAEGPHEPAGQPSTPVHVGAAAAAQSSEPEPDGSVSSPRPPALTGVQAILAGHTPHDPSTTDRE